MGERFGINNTSSKVRPSLIFNIQFLVSQGRIISFASISI